MMRITGTHPYADKNPVRGYVLGNEYISQVDGTSFGYYLNDEQGSVRYLTGSDGSIRNHYRYSAFGETITAEEIVPNRLRYNGQMADGLTGLYYLRARYYNASLGRFTQEDVIYNDGLNLYAYCNSNPVMYSDPSGFAAKSTPKGCNPKNGGEKDSKSGSNGSGNALSGPVEFKAPPGATPSQIQQVKDYVNGCNEALKAEALSSTGRVSTKGDLRRQASAAARNEKIRAQQAGTPYSGHAGHVPDTTWTGRPQPYSWLDLDPIVNTSLGGQSTKYPVGYKPTIFIFTED